jgi:hypothetical protein
VVSYSIAYTSRHSKIRILGLLLLVINSFIVMSEKMVVIHLGFGISAGTMSVVSILRGLETLYLRDDLIKPFPHEVNYIEPWIGTILQHILRGVVLFLDTRDAGTQFQSKKMPTFLSSRPRDIPTKCLYLLQLVLNILADHVLVSLTQSLIPEDRDIFSSDSEPLLSRIGGIGAFEILLRVILTGHLWLLMRLRIQLFAAPILFLMLFVFNYPVADFPPIFGASRSMYSIRGFWGYVRNQRAGAT